MAQGLLPVMEVPQGSGQIQLWLPRGCSPGHRAQGPRVPGSSLRVEHRAQDTPFHRLGPSNLT